MCMVKTVLKLWYITYEGRKRGKIKKKKKRLRNKSLKEEHWTLD